MQNEQFSEDSLYLQKVVIGYVDVTDSTVVGRLNAMRDKYGSQDMTGMIDLINRAFAAREHYEHQADLDFLEGLLGGVVDCFGDDVSDRIMPMYGKYPEGSPTHQLLEKAVAHYGGVIVQKTREVLRQTDLAPKTVFVADLFNSDEGKGT